MLKSMGIDTA